MNREEALKRIAKLSCPYKHLRMTECPHCKPEVESLVKTSEAMVDDSETT